MRGLIERFDGFRAPEGEGGSGAAAGAGAAAGSGNAAGAGAAAGGSAAASGAAGEGGAGAAGGAGGAGGAGAGAAAGAGAEGGGPYRPEGLAEQWHGKDDRETIDKLHQAVKGYRDRDATRGVPEAPDAYRAFDLAQAPEAIRPHLEGLASDPLFDAVAKVALEEKVPVATMQKLTSALYSQALEAGVLEAVIDPVKERAALLPDSANGLPKAQQEAAIEARLQANEDFIKLLGQAGADGKPQLDPAVGEHALLMLMDTAKGNQFIEFVRTKLTGGDRAQPLNGGAGGAQGGDARKALQARAAAPEMNPDHPKFDKAAWDQLQADYKRLGG